MCQLCCQYQSHHCARTNLHVLVGQLLPFLAHSLWCWASEVASSSEKYSTCSQTSNNPPHDNPFLTRIGKLPWSVGSECNPVSCVAKSAPSIHLGLDFENVDTMTALLPERHNDSRSLFYTSILDFTHKPSSLVW